MLERITHDLFDITGRLKNINSRYAVFYNHATCRYEVHNSARPGRFTLCFTVPYAELDTRTLDYAYQTRVENFDELEQQSAHHNAELERSAQKAAVSEYSLLADMMDFAAKKEHEVIFKKNKRWF